MIIYGPKGKGWFRLIFLQNSKIIPITAPITHYKNKSSKTFFNPKTIPVIPNNFIAPAPIPPRLTKIITGIVLGLKKVLLAFFLSCVIGAVIGMILLFCKKISRNQPFPFGPYIIIATLICYYFRSEEHTSELQSRGHLVCRLLLEKKKISLFIF